MLWQAADVNVCFVDYLYPLMCGTWAIVDILRDAFSTNSTSVGAICLNAGDVNGVELDLTDSRVSTCLAFVGLETSATLAKVDAFITGPSYNYSSDIVFPTKTSKTHNGWAFLSAFSWGVWLALLGVVVATVIVQFTMRLLKTDTSPVLTHENAAEIVSRSLLSTIGTSRLYDRAVLARRILSCVIAVFAFVIISLYGSNLVNSFYRMNTAIQEPTDIHPALRILVNRGVSTLDVIPNGEFTGVPIVSRVIAKHFNDTFKLTTFAENPVLYQVYITRALAPVGVYDILKDVQRRLNYRQVDVRALFEKGDAVFKLTLADTWGLFVFILVGYAVSIATRVLFTNKKGLCARYTGSNTPETSVGFLTPFSGSPTKAVISNVQIIDTPPQINSPTETIYERSEVSPTDPVRNANPWRAAESDLESQLEIQSGSESVSGFFDSPGVG